MHTTRPSGTNCCTKPTNELQKRGREGERLPRQQHRASGRQQDPSACLAGQQEHSPSTRLGDLLSHVSWKPCTPQHVAHGRTLPYVSTTSVINCQDGHTHTLSMSSSLCRQLKPWTETAPSYSSQKPLSHCCRPATGTGVVEPQEEQVLLQETSWSLLQRLLLPLQQTAFLTRAQTY